MKNNKQLINIFFLSSTIILFAYVVIFFDKNKKDIEIFNEVKNNHVSKKLYDIEIDSLFIIKDVVKRNENLSEILLKYNVDYPTINKLVKKSKNIFNVRNIKRGNKYTIIFNNDSIRKVLYFVYENSQTGYIVYELNDSIRVYKGEKLVKKQIKSVSGEINSSLWNTLKDKNINPVLAVDLSEIYAWTIDFFEIKKGDKFKIIYEDLFVDNKNIGLGKVLASCITHKNDDYYAFYFVQKDKGEYFDEKGNSLQRTFLKAPLRYRRISSRFSNSRYHPILKIRRPHHGVDYAAPTGTPVHSVGDGVIIKKGYQKRGAGNYIKIKHNSVYITLYGHLSRFARGIKKGVAVKQGQTIGYVGKTGLATGPHLDFRVFKNGHAINPLKMHSPSAKPVDTAYLKNYLSVVNKYLAEFDSLNVISK
ncbi:MAG: peptidoglycan DD-metalloendopeptidase family protein [Bacteroidales bacterium]|nr:peptidoglycan DD-metalloendopeptidase family protein [Bacteroidales bacterium]